MLQINFVLPDGQRQLVNTSAGISLMEAAMNNGVPGIPADCGGACACATCHVYVAPEWSAKLPTVQEVEDAMLDFVDDRKETSRLSCQIHLVATYDGLVVEVPSQQA